MPWHTVKDHAECGDGKWAVVKDDGGEVEGCHMSEADAQKQMAALYANEGRASALDVDVVRALGAPPEFRADGGDDTIGTLRLSFSAFDTWYRVDSVWEGTFYERTMSGTFVDTIAEDRSLMRVLFDHGFDPQIGNKVLGPIRDLREDSDSPRAEVPLFDTTYNRDLLPGLRAGVYGSSFRMRVPKGGDDWNDKPGKSAHNPDGIPERTIRRAKVMEFGPVTFPANPSATATVRSMTDYFYDQLRQRDTSAFEAAARAAGRLPDLTAARTRSAGGRDPDAEPGTGKAPMSMDELRTVERALKALGAIDGR